MHVGAVKSLLQRARRRLEDVNPKMDDVIEPTHPRARELLEQYMAAFDNADTGAFERLLRDNAVLEMPAARTWFSGKRECVPFLADHVVGPLATGAAWPLLRTGSRPWPGTSEPTRDVTTGSASAC